MERHFEDSRIGDLKARLARGELTRRDFLDSMVGLGFSASAARRTLGNWNVNRGADGPSLEEKTFRITTYRLYLGDKMLVTVGGEAIAARAIIECKGENQEQLTLHFLSTDRSGEANNSDKHGNTTDISSNKALGN